MIDEIQLKAHTKSFPRDILTPGVIAIGMDSKTSNSNIKLKTAEEMAMELLLERVYILEKKVFELENKF